MNNISPNIPKNGLIGGSMVVAYMIALYIIDPALMFMPLWSAVPFFFIFPAAMTLSVLADRDEQEGYIKMEEAFKTAFLTGAMALFFLVAFNFIMKTAVDPSLVSVERQTTIELTTNLMEAFGGDNVNPDDMDKIIEDLETVDLTPNLGSTFISFLLTAAFGAIPALIIAAILRKLRPIGYKEKENRDNVLDDFS